MFTDFPSTLSRAENALVSRSGVTESGRGMVNAGRFVRASRVNSVCNTWARRGPGAAVESPAVPPAALLAVPPAIDSINLSPASMNEAAASSTPLPPGVAGGEG